MAGEENTLELEQISAEVKKSEEALIGRLKKQDEELAKYGETTDKTAASLKKAEESVDQLVADYKGWREKLEAKLGEEGAEILERIAELEKKGQRPAWPGGDPVEIQSPGQLFEADEAKSQLRDVASRKRSSVDVECKNLFAAMDRKSTFMSDAATRLVMPQRTDMVSPMTRTLRIRDLMPVRTTASNAIEYIRETGFAETGAATGTQTHGAAAPHAEGAEAPEAQLEMSFESTPVRDISHWLPATRQVLDDVSMMRSYVDDRLIYGLQYKEEEQLLYGDGASPNLEGIMVNSDRQTYAWSAGLTLPVADTKLDAVRRAATKAYISYYSPTGAVLHPTDWEEIETAKGTDGHYIWLRVSEGAGERIFRMPVVVTTAIVAGDGLVGAFAMGATLWDREQAFIRATDSHKDLWSKQIIAIMATERVALEIRRPDAFVDIDFDAAPT